MASRLQRSNLWQRPLLVVSLLVVGFLVISPTVFAEEIDLDEKTAVEFMKEPVPVENAAAKAEAEMKPYTETIQQTDATFDMVPIAGGKFMMGSPEDEADRADDEGPQHDVVVEPFWMGKFEVTWDEYEQWSMALDRERRKINKVEPSEWDKVADALSKPTPPYSDMSFDMGKEGFPAVCMTQLAAKLYCKWLSAKTGRYYRLPTEAEWEYACRAGTKTAYSFGDDVDDIDDYAWHYENSDDAYHKVGQKKPNPWGLYDMHGNVAEWCLDQHVEDIYGKTADKTIKNPYAIPKSLYPRIVRGGSWDDDPDALRSAARRGSDNEWKAQDPQIPQSIWYHTDAPFLGFRIVRPLKTPSVEDAKKYEPDVEKMREYKKAQRGKH
jgi:formylglycine-generating enzyme required for sulfatase activity